MVAGIYEPSELCSPEDRMDATKTMQNCVVNVCQTGSGLLAAGYCLYSSSVIFMLSIGNGCYGFTYDSLVGEFILTHPDLKARLSSCPCFCMHPHIHTSSGSWWCRGVSLTHPSEKDSALA